MGDYADDMIDRLSFPDFFRGSAYDRVVVHETFNDPSWYQTEYHQPKDKGKKVLLTDMNPYWRGNCIRLWTRKLTTEQGKRELMELPLVKKMIELGADGFD